MFLSISFKWHAIEVDVIMVRRILLHEKITSWYCFEVSGLNNIFNLYAHCNILDRFSLRDSDEKLESRTIKYIEVPLA